MVLRRIFAWFAVALLPIAVGAADENGRPLRVLAYNIHHGEGVDGRLDLARIAQVILATRADIAALQEVDVATARTGGVDQAAELGRLTGLHATFGRAMDYQGGAYGQVLLSRWPPDAFAVIRLPNPAGREPRIAVTAIVRAPGRPAFRFVGTHLDASRDDGDRWLQAGALVERLAAEPLPLVLAGDLNARPDSRVMQRFLAQLTDASAAAPAFTVPAAKPTARIDYVLVQPADAWRVVSSTVIPEAVASDHRPVLVELVPIAPAIR